MKTLKSVTVSFSLIILVLSSYFAPSEIAAAVPDIDDNLSTTEILAKHLDSIGTAEARKAVKSITIVGTSQAVFKGRGEGRAEGIVVLASQAEKSMIGMKFNNSDYPYEKLGFDGSAFSVGFVRPGEYTVLGGFLRVNEKTFRSGILGGVLSTSWELLTHDVRTAKLSRKGRTKVDGVELLKFEYNPKKGSDLDIAFFFDPVTFRHVRTEYKRTISGGQGLSVDQSSRQSETRYKMVEKFSGFAEETKLMLPHNYEIYLEMLTRNGTTSYTWTMDLTNFNFNQVLADDEFKVDG